MSAIVPAAKFRHEAMLYAGSADFVYRTVPFIKEGVRSGEPVFVVESPEKISLLRSALDDDAEHVMFADMAEVGANPARIIPAWQDFVARHGGDGRRLRGIGEPIWNGRPADELIECQHHEALLNVAFGRGQPWWLLCPYDTSQLPDSVIEEALRSHEYVMEDGATRLSSTFAGIDDCAAPLAAPLAGPTPGLREMAFGVETLFTLRRVTSRFALAAGSGAERAKLFVSAVNEVATNAILHGGGGGTLRLWRDGNKLIAEVRDSGDYTRPLADRHRPGPQPSDPRGLWLANQLCDLVQIRAVSGGTVFRLHMKVDPRRHLQLVEDETPAQPPTV